MSKSRVRERERRTHSPNSPTEEQTKVCSFFTQKTNIRSRPVDFVNKLTFLKRVDFPLHWWYYICTETKGEKKMIWTIYKIWLISSLVLCYLGHKTEKDIYGFIAIISTIAMFYVPFMV